MSAAKGNDGVGTLDGPEHAGLFETGADDGFTPRFHNAGTDKKVLLAAFRFCLCRAVSSVDLHPGFLIHVVIGIQLERHIPKMLAPRKCRSARFQIHGTGALVFAHLLIQKRDGLAHNYRQIQLHGALQLPLLAADDIAANGLRTDQSQYTRRTPGDRSVLSMSSSVSADNCPL